MDRAAAASASVRLHFCGSVHIGLTAISLLCFYRSGAPETKSRISMDMVTVRPSRSAIVLADIMVTAAGSVEIIRGRVRRKLMPSRPPPHNLLLRLIPSWPPP
jgi:hypothetical protein